MTRYFDYNATTPLADCVVSALVEALALWENPSSASKRGQMVRDAIETARRNVAASLGADAREILFCSGGTEANNTVIDSCRRTDRPHIVASQVEHPSVLNAVQAGDFSLVPVDAEGQIDPADVAAAIRPDTSLVSVMWANNETGILSPICEIGNICRERNVLFHVDAVQAFGKIPIQVHKLPVDFLSVSAHKVYGPKGIGALYIKHRTRFQPLIRGGHQERGRRAGTEATPAIIGFGAATLQIPHLLNEVVHLTRLRDQLEEALSQLPHIRFNRSRNRLANTSNITLPGKSSKMIVQSLDAQGFQVSGGAACSTGSPQPSHVLTAMGLSPQDALASIRISLGRWNTSKAVHDLAQAIRAL